jgi:hypothetical protein
VEDRRDFLKALFSVGCVKPEEGAFDSKEFSLRMEFWLPGCYRYFSAGRAPLDMKRATLIRQRVEEAWQEAKGLELP